MLKSLVVSIARKIVSHDCSNLNLQEPEFKTAAALSQPMREYLEKALKIHQIFALIDVDY